MLDFLNWDIYFLVYASVWSEVYGSNSFIETIAMLPPCGQTLYLRLWNKRGKSLPKSAV